MQIFWHGLTCIRLEATHGEKQATLVTDPYENETGLRFPRTLTPDIVTFSHQDQKRFSLDAFTNKPFVISDPGEYEVSGIFSYVYSLPNGDKESRHPLMYRFETEGMSVAFLGGLNRVLTEEELGKLENIDVLLLPVGGGDKLGAKQAVEVIQVIEPRIVVPLNFQLDGLKTNLGTVDAFLKELGTPKKEAQTKLKLSKKDLPAEDMMVVVLERA